MIKTHLSPGAAAVRREQPLRANFFFGKLNPAMDDWRGRRVWLVGASSGIGRALAEALHAAGARVIVSARGREALRQFAAAHPRALALPVDVCDAAAVRVASQALLEHGPLDCVVYCAAHYRAQTAMGFDLQEMVRHQQVNYVGALNVLDAVLPGLLAQGRGHVSLLGSVAGYRGLPRSLAYGPTKAALINLAEALYLDLRSRGIGVSLVNPGFVETPLTAQNEFEMPALITAPQAARQILHGWKKGRFEIHFPRRFTLGMKLLRLMPFRWYQALAARLTRG